MAVCGRCWLCDRKFGCVIGQSCGDCLGDSREILGRIQVGAIDYKICTDCLRLAQDGSISALIMGLRIAIEP